MRWGDTPAWSAGADESPGKMWGGRGKSVSSPSQYNNYFKMPHWVAVTQQAIYHKCMNWSGKAIFSLRAGRQKKKQNCGKRHHIWCGYVHLYLQHIIRRYTWIPFSLSTLYIWLGMKTDDVCSLQFFNSKTVIACFLSTEVQTAMQKPCVPLGRHYEAWYLFITKNKPRRSCVPHCRRVQSHITAPEERWHLFPVLLAVSTIKHWRTPPVDELVVIQAGVFKKKNTPEKFKNEPKKANRTA